MINEFKVIFLGICTVANMAIDGVQDARRVIIPNLKGTEVVNGHPIPRHRAFIMFPEAAYVSSNGGWLKPQSTIVHNGVRRAYYFLDGDKITFSNEPQAIDTSAHNIFRLQTACPQFGNMDDSYLNGEDPDVKKGHVNLTFGTLRVRRMFSGMRATELKMRSNQPNLTITATSWRYGTSRSVTLGPGTEVWIGNMIDSFFDKVVPPHPGGHPHFLAYYLMSEQPNSCSWVPSDSAPAAKKDLSVTCSNSGYP